MLIIRIPNCTFNSITSDCKNSCVIDFFCPLNQFCCFFIISTSTGSLLNLISERPHNDSRVVLSSSDSCFQIKLCPCHIFFCTENLISFFDRLIKPSRIIVRVCIFVEHPTVKELIDYNHSFFIADINQRRCCRVVCHTDRITSHFFQNFHLTFNSASVCFSP